MDNGKTNERTAQRINAQSAELQSELQKHVEEVQRDRPDMTDVGLIFEGWIVQKIAGLQCLVMDLSEKVSRVESKRK